MRTLIFPLLAPLFAALAGAQPDARHAPLKDLNGYFPFTVPASREAWDTRAAAVRLQTQVALGLHPMPPRTPLNAVIHGRLDLGDYSVEKVYFESMPGFYVTGSLYRGKAPGKVPGVLCPHGHWNDGRFLYNNDGTVKEEMATGAEKLESGARSPLQARCVHLARMGCTVFHYDMIGYADSLQLSYELAHKFAKQRADANEQGTHGLFSPAAEGHLQSILGLQAWNSIRGLDFLESLPEVDAARLGVTGASGGGTQTFLLGALDPRPAAVFPCVMVSTAMQGGCTCENSSLLRIGTGNVEFAALFAPKPLGMTAANDWTKEMSTKGFPELQSLYRLLGQPENVMLHNRTEFGHNYNLPSRLAMYGWLGKHLKSPNPAPAEESDFRVLKKEELTVWDEDHPAPEAGSAAFEQKLLAAWSHVTEQALTDDPEARRTGLSAIIGRPWEQAGACEWDMHGGKHDRGEWLEMSGTVRNTTHGENVAATFLHPKNWNGRVVLWLQAPSAVVSGNEIRRTEVKELLASGAGIALADLYTEPAGSEPDKARKVENPREAPAYTHGYNTSVTVKRAHDVLTLLTFIKYDQHGAKQIDVVAPDSAAPDAALALTQLPESLVSRAVLHTAGWHFAGVKDIRSLRLLPGALRYGDLPGIAKLARAGKVTVIDTPQAEKLLPQE